MKVERRAFPHASETVNHQILKPVGANREIEVAMSFIEKPKSTLCPQIKIPLGLGLLFCTAVAC